MKNLTSTIVTTLALIGIFAATAHAADGSDFGDPNSAVGPINSTLRIWSDNQNFEDVMVSDPTFVTLGTKQYNRVWVTVTSQGVNTLGYFVAMGQPGSFGAQVFNGGLDETGIMHTGEVRNGYVDFPIAHVTSPKIVLTAVNLYKSYEGAVWNIQSP